MSLFTYPNTHFERYLSEMSKIQTKVNFQVEYCCFQQWRSSPCYWAMRLTSRVFANSPGDRGSISKTQKWYLMRPCLTLSIIRYVLKLKWSNPGEGIASSSTPRCSSYWKRSLWVTLDWSRQLFFTCILRTGFEIIIENKWRRITRI